MVFISIYGFQEMKLNKEPILFSNTFKENKDRSLLSKAQKKMKFGKELASQMVQEWQEAYIDYKHLKKLLKNILKFRQQKSGSRGGLLERTLSLYRSFSGLTVRDNGVTKSEDEVILILAHSEDDQFYQTKFLKTSEDDGEKESHFFKIVDDEFNKVLRFYKEKVKEVTRQAEELSRQMDTLISLRILVYKPAMEQYGNHQEIESSDVEHDGTDPANPPNEELGTSSESASEDEPKEADKVQHDNLQPASLSHLDHVKINIESNCPLSTLKRVIKRTKRSDLTFRIEELRQVEDKLRRAFIEYYQLLGLLKRYRLSNMFGFSKIMKKYDKITSRSASKTYLQIIDKSDLGSCNDVDKLMGRVEATFVKYFSSGNRRKGVKLLRPRNKVERHRTTFTLGILTGCLVTLVAGIIVTIHERGLIQHECGEQYMNNIFPLYSLFVFIFLHIFMHGINTYLWRRFRVNYPFIFGFKSGTELGFREIFLLASALSVLSMVAVLSNLDMEMDPRTQSYQTITELVPAGLVMVLLLITFCPFNIIYRSSRFFLIQSAWHCLLAPFYKVTFSDFFLADQLTSQVQAFRSLQFYICYYGWGDFKRRSNRCLESKVYEIFHIVVAIIPFWSRALQCLRRMFEEKDLMQGLNSLKYLSTVAALIIRTLYDLRRGRFWKIMAASSSGVTTVFSTYWDVVMDWGLLQKRARNPWLRDKLLISNKGVYFVAIIVNILLRLVWMQLVLDFDEAPFLHRRVMIALVACLEILRRGIWNFFRLENEHFNNVEKYRAVKLSPLPFYYENEKCL